MSCQTDPACIFPGSPPLLLARVEFVDSFDLEPATQADVATITYSVTDLSTGTATVSGSLVVASVIYDTLQTGEVWTTDATGFNFAHRPPVAAVPSSNKTYLAEYVITSSGGEVAVLQFEMQTKKKYSA